ncbi:MAG: hypothetical protein HY565_05800 [Candidatus Kerfeldbacteria bacterium]|nr:hypothetical protein [Candidatus Kerfeldbacteria bacterium]
MNIERRREKPASQKSFVFRLARLVSMALVLGVAEPSMAAGKRTIDQQCGLDPVEAAPLLKSGKEVVADSMKDITVKLLTAQEVTGPVVETIVRAEITDVVKKHLVPPFAELIEKTNYIKAGDYTDKYNCLYSMAELSIRQGEGIRATAQEFLKKHLGEELGILVWAAVERDFGKDQIEQKLSDLLDHAADVFWEEIEKIMTQDLNQRVQAGDLTRSKEDQEYVLFFAYNEQLPTFLKQAHVRQWFVDLMRMNVLDGLKDKQVKDINTMTWMYESWEEKLPGFQVAVQHNFEIQEAIVQRLMAHKNLFRFGDDLSSGKQIVQFTPDQKTQLLAKLDSFRATADHHDQYDITRYEGLIRE